MANEIEMILWRNKYGYTMSHYVTKADYEKQMRNDINTLCTYIEKKETHNEDVTTD